jgi:Flp pilus assembly secretin CpaC
LIQPIYHLPIEDWTDVTHRTPIHTASLVTLIAALGFIATDRALAAEPHVADMQVISSDETTQFMALGMTKSAVIELPTDMKDVVVADPSIVTAVVKS